MFEGHLKHALKKARLQGVALRPITFMPTFQKQVGKVCGGFQIHVTDKKVFQPWRVGQWLLRELYHLMDDDFQWLDPPYEYDYINQPIDIINGTDRLRHWVENNESIEMLRSFEDFKEYRQMLDTIKIYEE